MKKKMLILILLVLASPVVACPLCAKDTNSLAKEEMAIIKEYVEVYGYDAFLKELLKFKIEMLNKQINPDEIVVILDRSGSMENIKDEMVGGLKQFVSDQKKVVGRANFTLVQFDTEYEVIYDGVDIQEVNEIDLVPRGWTALLDALGKTIENTSKRLAKTPDRKVIFVIITDGLENSSKEFSKPEIADSISHAMNKHNWKFIYLGANQDAIQEGGSFGIDLQNCVTYDSSNVSGTLDAMSVSVSSFRNNPNK